MAKLWVHPDAEHLAPAFIVPDAWLRGWGAHGFDHVYRFTVPQPAPISYEMSTQAVLRDVPVVTVQIKKAYREGPMAVLEPHIVLLGGGRWLVGHPAVKELSHASAAPV